jgi:mono/diheme cytochrome c family protein
MQSVNITRHWPQLVRWFVTSLAVLLLQACSGGSGGGASDREGVVSTNNVSSFVYSGPVPVNSEIQNFKTSFYDNVVIRCGSCHTSGGVGTTAFVDNDDVNFAWEEAKTVANLLDPSASDLVSRLENGHNCWLSSNASCAASMTGYIERWAQGASQSTSTVTLIPRTPQQLAGLKILPASYSDAIGDLSFDLTVEPELMYLLNTYCSDCHSGTAASPQSPYFGSDNPTIAYAAMSGKIDLANPGNSRFVVRLEDRHNCWTTDCNADAQVIENAIARLAADLSEVDVDDNLVMSKAQVLEEDGIIASGGGRYESDVIAKWEFREGEGSQVADTSGVQPEMPLTVLGEFEWFGGWGVRLENGRVQAAVSGSTKLHERIATAGEFTIEAWIAPNNVTQEDAWIVGYAGGPENRNVLLTQTLYNYDFYNRSSTNAESSGGPATSTSDDDEIAQASLQHVVLTYDPINGRKIYVNGQDTGVVDEQGPGTLSNWSNAFALVMGNDFSGGSPWQGVIRMVAVHGRSLTQEQIFQNYDIGVGQKYFLMFSISDLLPQEDACHSVDAQNIPIDYCYIVYEVGQFDSSSYLFSAPRFVNINPDQPDADIDFVLKGIYLGINGQLARTGQGFVNINAAISGNLFTIEDEPLQQAGTIVPLENGPENDVFFLAFEEINGEVDKTTDPVPGAFSFSYPSEGYSQIGMRTFDEVNQTFSWVTGIPIDSNAVSAVTGKTVSETFNTVRRSLASVPDFQTYMASHQMAVTQLAGAYCDALVEDPAARALLFTDGAVFDFDAAVESVTDNTWSNQVIYPLIDKVFATGLESQPSRPLDGDAGDGFADRGDVHDVLLNLITEENDDAANELTVDGKKDGLKFCIDATCPVGRTKEVVKAVCTTVLASAPALMK